MNRVNLDNRVFIDDGVNIDDRVNTDKRLNIDNEGVDTYGGNSAYQSCIVGFIQEFSGTLVVTL